MFCPVHGLLLVVGDMVAVVPAFMIVLGIDAGDAVPERVARIGRVDKGVLRPVAHHGDQPVEEEWDDEYHQRSRPVDKAHAYTKQDKEQLAAYGTIKQTLPFFAEEISA